MNEQQDVLLERAIRGDELAILELIERDEDILYRTAYAFTKNEQDALDAMQDLTYKALRHMKKVKEPQYVRTWLMRVLINCCKDLLKKRPKIGELSQEPTIIEQHYIDVHNMLEKLPPSERQLLYFKYFQQLKNHEIAQLTNLPEGTVKSKLHYILKKLRKSAGERSDWL
jgi:RNA polymerase sigma factor (sigma-70 family)